MAGADPYSLEDAELDIAAVLGQVDRMSEAIPKNDATDPPNTPAAGLIHYSSAGHHKYASADASYYNTGRATVIASGTTLINSLSDITIAGLSLTVGTGTYLLTGVVRGVNGANVAQQAVGLNGPAASFCNVDIVMYSVTSFVFEGVGEITSLGGRVGTTSNLPANEKWVAHYDGLITFTAAGTLVITGSCVTAAADPWTAQARSRISILPVT